MSLWQRLFGEEMRSRDGLIVDAELAEDISANLTGQLEAERRVHAVLQARLDRTELVLEGLIRELEACGALDIRSLKEQILRLDMTDGLRDNRMSGEITSRVDQKDDT